MRPLLLAAAAALAAFALPVTVKSARIAYLARRAGWRVVLAVFAACLTEPA